MRILTWVVAVVALLWGGYWFVGSRAVESAAQGWFAMQQDRGMIAEHGGLSVAGFPNRFDLTVTDLHLADPDTGYAWTAPLLQFASMSWKPWHVLVGFPQEQTIQTPYGDISLTSAQTEASLVLVPGPDMALDRTVLISKALQASLPQGGAVTAEELRFATRADPSVTNAQEIGLNISGLAPDAALLARLPQTANLPPRVETLTLDAVAGFSAPLDRHAEQSHPTLDRLILKQAVLNWGDVQLDLSGDLTADVNGFADGRVELKLKNGAELLAVAAAAGLIPAASVATYTSMLARLQRASGGGDSLNVPLTLSRGQIRFGLIPLGAAPRFR